MLNDSALPSVSAIVPVFNDLQRLHKCLAALATQIYPSELYEIVVVDNGSERSIINELACYQQVVYTYEPIPGSYAARNRGISIAKGKVIAFTDSDCIPQPEWLLNGVRALLSNPELGIVGGKVELFYQNPQQLTAVELYESLHAFPQKDNIDKFHFSVTANLFTFKHLFEEVGRFNQRLKSNGDREWCHRVFDRGYQLAYEAQAVVMHPARHSLAEMYRKHLRIVGGQEQLKPKFNLGLILGFLPPLKYCWRVLRLKQKYSLVNKVQIILVMGILKYGGQLERIRIKTGSLAQR
ncbi:glycosyltransferase [Myxosarcina sp. GI1(2024)]